MKEYDFILLLFWWWWFLFNQYKTSYTRTMSKKLLKLEFYSFECLPLIPSVQFYGSTFHIVLHARLDFCISTQLHLISQSQHKPQSSALNYLHWLCLWIWCIDGTLQYSRVINGTSMLYVYVETWSWMNRLPIACFIIESNTKVLLL